MTTQHADEFNIQQFALNPDECSTTIVNHIQHCKNCQVRVSEYRLLFEKVIAEGVPKFDFNVSDLIMDKLNPGNRRSVFDRYMIFFIFTAVVCSAILLLYVFKLYLPVLLESIDGQTLNLTIVSFTGIFLFLCYDIFRNYAMRIKNLEMY